MRPETTPLPSPSGRAGDACPGCGAALDAAAAIVAPDRHHGVQGTFSVRTCRACGSGRTFPLAADVGLGALYPSGYGAHSALPGRLARAISWAIRRWQGFVALRSRPLDQLAGGTPGTVLDVGCGRGDLGAVLLSHGWRVTGLEPSPAACEEARRRGIDAREGTLADGLVEPSAYDAVVFQHSLEHTNEPLADLERARDALRPGGVVLVSLPNFGGWQARRFGGSWYHLDLPRHRVHLTCAGLSALCERAGLELDWTGTSTSPVGLPASVQYAIFGRCLFPSGMALRVAIAACTLALPLATAADRLRGGGDVLHAVARRAS
jgi:SAM-dependent methyltransferase